MKAGCIPFKVTKKGKVKLLKVRGTRCGWVFPKGTVKRRESKKQAAKREAWEEAGVTGKIVGTMKTKKGNRFYLLKITKRKQSPEKRQIKWIKPQLTG